jgi:nucleosome-remodeling factor subunit
MASGYSIVPRGSLYTETHRLFFKNADGVVISPMHDIPISYTEGANEFNMIVEVPRWSNAKMEINLTEKFNPIKQDIKKGKPRFVANCFPHKGYIWNYGAIPQTWEDPEHTDVHTNAKGDGDPVDVCDIGSKVHPSGSIIKVKVLGTLARIDEGETDWKVIGINTQHPLAAQLNSVEDIDKHLPGVRDTIIDWFKMYKTTDGKPENSFYKDVVY